jgi:cell division protein FtsN
MSRIALVGSIFVAVLFLVCVGFFIARRPVSPQPNRTSQQAPPPAAPTPSPSEQHPAAVPTPPPVKITAAPSAAPATVHPAGAHFTVDSGLFQDRNNAETLAARIPKQYKTEITPLTVRGKKLYRVRTTVPSESDAKVLAANLARDLHLQARITPIHQP